MVLEQEHGNVLTKSWLSKNKSQRWNRAHHLGYGACGGKNFLIVHETSLLQQDVDPGKILPGTETQKEGNWHTLPGFKTLETQENVCIRSRGWMEAGSFSNTLHHSHLSGREPSAFPCSQSFCFCRRPRRGVMFSLFGRCGCLKHRGFRSLCWVLTLVAR